MENEELREEHEELKKEIAKLGERLSKRMFVVERNQIKLAEIIEQLIQQNDS